MRLPTFRKISLAGKVGLLFAGAVLLIVSAALFVPWDRMQRLVKEQDLAEARHLATVRLLERCMGTGPPGSPREPGRATATSPAVKPPADQSGPIAQLWTTLRPEPHQREQAHVEFLVPAPDRKSASGLIGRGLDHFATHPTDIEVYRYRHRLLSPGGEPVDDRSDVGQEKLVLEYVRALRITAECADCHVRESARRPFAANELVGLIYVRMPGVEPELWKGMPLNLGLVLGAGTIAVILAVVAFSVIMKSLVLSPVRKLRRLALRIGEGDLAVRATIRTGDEFERLATAFNSMLERLQAAQQRMRQINESLNSKMDELAKANIALFESNRLKSEFLARVSHELRTPLNSIIGFAEVLRDQMTDEQARRPEDPQLTKGARYAENILTSGRMLLELINDLLDLSKIEAGKIVVRVEKVVIRDLVEAVVNFMRPAAEKKSLQVTVGISPDLPLVETDGGKFQQILYNLFSNAVKFTPPRGSVTVQVRRQGDAELALSVADTGPGIPAEDQAGIFEKFHQLDQPATREHGGTGLGLAISQELAAMLGGRISLVSKLGEGSTFTLTLPLKAPQGQADSPHAEPPGEQP